MPSYTVSYAQVSAKLPGGGVLVREVSQTFNSKDDEAACEQVGRLNPHRVHSLSKKIPLICMNGEWKVMKSASK